MEAFLCKKYGANRAKIEVRQDKALLGGVYSPGWQ